MVRRPLRSSFSVSDTADLIERMRGAREAFIRLSASLSPTGERYRLCQAVTAAVDGLAGDLTGNARLFHAGGHAGLARER